MGDWIFDGFILHVVLRPRFPPELRRVGPEVERVVDDGLAPVDQNGRYVVVTVLLILVVADDDQRIELCVADCLVEPLDVARAGGGLRLQDLLPDLVPTLRVGLLQQLAIGRLVAVLVEERPAFRILLGVLGIV
ncbi:MAG: hypothetical protein WB822_09155, partial [Rhodoplanes sp.]